MFKQDIKTITQANNYYKKDAGAFYDTISNHPKDNVNKEMKSFVRAFEVCSRSSFYDYCVFILPNHLEYFSQIEITENMLNDIKEKSNFYVIIGRTGDVKTVTSSPTRSIPAGCKQFMDNQNQAKQEFDNEFKEREQKLIKEYRTMMVEALRGVYDPSVSVTSNITSGSSSKLND
ncbi:biogenesis of lysosome-related organelles complex 1 subunit 5-like [Gigaspora margarita]|uniref:Biogenesis of lysosome-related organelles complex 1 subunit 5-like n=1 Tax=Gigaspora margarita TaxID=4874 RepID=A0A8H3XLN8_GIGMA|nr:biogenesis of lysosome-related organelles complex 1 subunit 5-like [Gigaspora margarita]